MPLKPKITNIFCELQLIGRYRRTGASAEFYTFAIALVHSIDKVEMIKWESGENPELFPQL